MASGSPLAISAAALSTDAVNSAIKIHYKSLRVKNMVYKDNPWLAMIPKYTSFGGLSMPIPLRYHDPQRRAADFSTAQSNTSTSGLVQFSIKRSKDYSFAFIDGETIQATKGDKNAFLQYLTMEIDGAVNSLTRSLAVALYGDGTGKLGAVATGGVTAGSGSPAAENPDVITLAQSEDITNFEVGMNLVAAANAATNAGAALTVTAVDRENGTFSVAQGTASGKIAAGDLVFQEGDYASANDTKKVFGLDAWVPSTAPTGADSFNGVNRSSDPTRLGGVRFDGSSMPIEEAIYGAAAQIAREGGNPDTALCDFATYATLEKALGARIVYDTVKAPDVDIGFSGIRINGPRGPIRVVPDYNCQSGVIWLLQRDTWVLASLGEAPQFLDLDSMKMLRDAGADAYEVRLGYYASVGCFAPGWNCRIAL